MTELEKELLEALQTVVWELAGEQECPIELERALGPGAPAAMTKARAAIARAERTEAATVQPESPFSNIERAAKPNVWTCDECGERTRSIPEMAEHIKQHTDLKP